MQSRPADELARTWWKRRGKRRGEGEKVVVDEIFGS
jgi:hypothetical protein